MLSAYHTVYPSEKSFHNFIFIACINRLFGLPNCCRLPAGGNGQAEAPTQRRTENKMDISGKISYDNSFAVYSKITKLRRATWCNNSSAWPDNQEILRSIFIDETFHNVRKNHLMVNLITWRGNISIKL